MDELTDELRSEVGTLRTEFQDIETRQQALITAGDLDELEDGKIETREDNELAELEKRCNAGEVYTAAFDGSVTSGAIRELQDHLGLSYNQVPLALIRRHNEEQLETRAVTPAPANVGADQDPIIPYVFPMAVGAFLGIDMPTVGVGEKVYPVLTKQLEVHTPNENADADETTGAFDDEVLKPKRIQASFFYSRESRAIFEGMDAALRQNLSEGLSDGHDRQLLVGPDGIFTGNNLAANAAGAETTFANYISQLGYGRVDGRYAGMVGDLRVVMGAAGYAHAGNSYRNNSVDRTALDRLMELTGGVRVSAHVPAVASKKQQSVVRRGMRRDMVSPVWEGITIIPDEVTKAKAGQIVVTAVMLHAVKILRAEGFHKQELQVAA